MRVKMNDAKANKVGNAEVENGKAKSEEVGILVSDALIESYNAILDKHGSIIIKDLLIGVGGGVAAFIWRVLDGYPIVTRYKAIMNISNLMFEKATNRIFGDVDK